MGATRVAGMDSKNQVNRSDQAAAPSDSPEGKILDHWWDNSGVGGGLATACADLEAKVRRNYGELCKDLKLISIGKCETWGTDRSWRVKLHFRYWRARDLVCGER